MYLTKRFSTGCQSLSVIVSLFNVSLFSHSRWHFGGIEIEQLEGKGGGTTGGAAALGSESLIFLKGL